ncbi:plasmid mobilization relaxosome protein MobC [Yimella sp. cx-51]|uniref:plasmid mobilization relaxosome protein MobC n=1 Tax=Yimella sp. cx-51 TaxID=2770551 RepID=UPI00165D45BD|nr:plasmid mobilization relaxosome protein MobC [Yimella sp. cx-51]MBC9958341.1 plasmid mobilization relaxosome protein MobC [Yimella sp. cx-51]QTH39760.1 plasmid mobilization relaxosome protein MobC [Yimella sp. cx-51]
MRVQALAAAQKISVPRLYERALTTGGVVASAKLSRIHDELYGVRRLLAIDSNNLNQLARVANATERLEAEAELLATIEHLSKVADRITAVIESLPDSERA